MGYDSGVGGGALSRVRKKETMMGIRARFGSWSRKTSVRIRTILTGALASTGWVASDWLLLGKQQPTPTLRPPASTASLYFDLYK